MVPDDPGVSARPGLDDTPRIEASGVWPISGHPNRLAAVDELDDIPDVRDGLTRLQRIVLVELQRARAELGRESVPTALLYGRVVERVSISEERFQEILRSLGAGPKV